MFSGDGGFNEALNGARPETCSASSPAAARACCPARSDCRRSRSRLRGRCERPDAQDLPRPRQRAPLRVRRGSRARRRADPPDGQRGRDESGKRPGDIGICVDGGADARRAAPALRPGARGGGHGRAAFALVANSDPYSYVGRVPLHAPPRATRRRHRPCWRLAPSMPGACRVAVRYLVTGETRLPHVLLARRDRIEVRCDAPMPLQLDGEDLGDVTEVVFEAERDVVGLVEIARRLTGRVSIDMSTAPRSLRQCLSCDARRPPPRGLRCREERAAAPTPLQREISGLAAAMADVHPEPFHDVSRARSAPWRRSSPTTRRC